MTATAAEALIQLGDPGIRRLTPAVLFSEFPSLLRKLIARRHLEVGEGARILRALIALKVEVVPTDERLILRAWDIATDLGQSDTFDALGYATAEAYDAEFWTCDRRFANAAAGRDYPRLRFIP